MTIVAMPRGSDGKPRSAFKQRCIECLLNGMCLAAPLDAEEKDKLNDIMDKWRPLDKNRHLFREGDPFHGLVFVRAGAVKTYRTGEDGEERITGFHLPGELLGLDGLADGVHQNSPATLETTSVCVLSPEQIGKIAIEVPASRERLLQLVSREYLGEQEVSNILTKNRAEERVAAFLLSLSRRYRARRLSATRIRLPMSRTDMANYLGLTLETMSRVFARLARQGVLDCERRELEIVDENALRLLAGEMSDGVQPREASN
jgi:CRP/FNR family transcriptional regulator